MPVNYDQLAEQYENHRKPDPRIAARIQFHTEGARRILNVGSGMGSYEPGDCDIVALEPSSEMNARKKSAKAALIQGVAEYLPFKDKVFDMSMAILSIHHWSDIASGLKEMARVSKYRLILFT
jgi:ubiquinone/menaquinone biosynthesis C-methylase UbiE